jgi:hypothetical protein
MASGVSADRQIVADEMVRIIGLPRGHRPRRAVADGSDYGAEIINGAAEELRHPRRKAPCPQTTEAGRFAARTHSCEHAASRAGSRRVAQAGAGLLITSFACRSGPGWSGANLSHPGRMLSWLPTR